jgi:hypothetical protein
MEWWFHLIGVGGGFRIDFSVPFGTKVGPHGCHVVMDSLLDIIGDEFVRYTDAMTRWTDDQWHQSQFDREAVLSSLDAMEDHADRRRLLSYPVLRARLRDDGVHVRSVRLVLRKRKRCVIQKIDKVTKRTSSPRPP